MLITLSEGSGEMDTIELKPFYIFTLFHQKKLRHRKVDSIQQRPVFGWELRSPQKEVGGGAKDGAKQAREHAHARHERKLPVHLETKDTMPPMVPRPHCLWCQHPTT